MEFKKVTLLLLTIGGMLLAGCEKRTADEPQREPGSFFRTGGDVVVGGH